MLLCVVRHGRWAGARPCLSYGDGVCDGLKGGGPVLKGQPQLREFHSSQITIRACRGGASPVLRQKCDLLARMSQNYRARLIGQQHVGDLRGLAARTSPGDTCRHFISLLTTSFLQNQHESHLQAVLQVFILLQAINCNHDHRVGNVQTSFSTL